MGIGIICGIGLICLPLFKIYFLLTYHEVTKEILLIDVICVILAIIQIIIKKPIALSLVGLWLYSVYSDMNNYRGDE